MSMAFSTDGSSRLLARRRRHESSARLRRQRPPSSQQPSAPWPADSVSGPSWLEEGLPPPERSFSPYRLLIYHKGELLERKLCAADQVRLGRSPDCEVTLAHPTVSRFHAVIERTGETAWVVRDQGSVNGIRVNTVRVHDHALRDGDVLALGELRIEFQSTDRLAPKLDDSDPGSLDFGRTIDLGPKRSDRLAAAAPLAVPKGYLRAEGGLQKGGLKLVQLVLDRDTFVIGAGDGVDLHLSAPLAPRVVALIVRSVRGFSLDPVVGWPFGPKVNGRRIDDLEPLEDGDEIALPGRKLSFHVGLPKASE